MLAKKYYALLPFSYMLVIFIMSSIPGNSGLLTRGVLSTILIPTVQNLLHIPLFGLLAILWIIAFKRYSFKDRSCLTWAVTISMGYGFLDEIYQHFIPGRHTSLTDIFLNLVGVFVGIFVYRSLSIGKVSTVKHSMV
jgi:VanZ family protein